MTNLGPLPTDFEESLGCARNLNDFYWVTITTNGYGYFIQGPVEQTSCFPSGYNGDNSQYYSPARCPIGFTTACSATELSETIVTCCPTCSSAPALILSIAAPSQSEYKCELSSIFTWQSTLGCVMNLSTSQVLFVTVVTDGGGETYQTATTIAGTGGFNAYAVQVRHQSADFASTTTLSTPATSSIIVASLTPTTTPNTENDNNNNNNGLSPGAAAGIAIGALAGGLIVVAIIWYLIRRNAQRQKQVQRDQPVRYQPNYDPYLRKPSTNPPYELCSTSTEPPQELV
ncbi:hypothetical protein F4803DRAFT_566598 [Xylaria telfairii]|nr:hypothetical protein F4803DRAFT_566598 [Xylaria telfairii]